jgi:hypothetical protein
MLFIGWSGKLLVTLASTFIPGSESCGTHDRILLPHDPCVRACVRVCVKMSYLTGNSASP